MVNNKSIIDVYTVEDSICIEYQYGNYENDMYLSKEEAKELITKLRDLVETTAVTKHLEQV